MRLEKLPSTFILSVELYTYGDWFIDYQNFDKIKTQLNNYNYKLNNDGGFRFEICVDYLEVDELDRFVDDFILIVNTIFKLKYHKTEYKISQSIFQHFKLNKESFIGTKFSNGNYDVVFKLKEKTEYIN